MKKFIRTLSLFMLPICLFIGIYAAIDVFRVVRSHELFYTEGNRIGLNRGYGSTVTYIQQREKEQYDAFIFGNSRSLFYEVKTWREYLPQDAHPFHFDASGGSVRGLRDKIVFIDRNGDRIRHALLVLDADLLGNEEPVEGYLYAEPPQLRNYTNWIDFQKQHFLAFLNLRFLTAWADYSLFGTYRPYMKLLLTETKEHYDPVTNEISEPLTEQQIAQGTYYDEAHIQAFDGMQFEGGYSNEKLSSKSIEWLQEIRRIFDRHHTDYRVIIGPQYDQLRLRPETLRHLRKIFGNTAVYDFSGPSKWSKDYHNYYEPYHYRPHVATEILRIVYR